MGADQRQKMIYGFDVHAGLICNNRSLDYDKQYLLVLSCVEERGWSCVEERGWSCQ